MRQDEVKISFDRLLSSIVFVHETPLKVFVSSVRDPDSLEICSLIKPYRLTQDSFVRIFLGTVTRLLVGSNAKEVNRVFVGSHSICFNKRDVANLVTLAD